MSQPTTAVQAERTAWQTVCTLVSGAALSPTVAVLRRAGVLDALARAADPVGVSAAAARFGLHEGYAHVAACLLTAQGLVERIVPDLRVREAAIALTAAGRRWVECAAAYDDARGRMDAARAVRECLLDGARGVSAPAFAALPSDGLARRVALHERGAVVSAIVGALGRLGALRRLYRAPMGWCPAHELGVSRSAIEVSLPPLMELGWVARDGDLIALTPEGRGAARWAPLFNYVYGYLRVYERATGLLLGESLGPPDEARDESDRDLLLTGKAYVFRTGLRAPLEERLRPRIAASDGPRTILDMNAGDGTVLAAVREMAEGVGRDVRLVALVRNRLAEARCRAALAGSGTEPVVVRVDFTDPDDVATRLEPHGIRIGDSLVISKTTIHDRSFRGGDPSLGPARGEPSGAVFVSPDGDWIEPSAMEDDLAAFFSRWRRHLGPHGLVAIDTHATPPEVAARTFEENAVTHVAASHGYSSQYLIECERFREAARRAGLSSRFQRDLGTDRVEAVTMSLDHFVAA